MRIEQQTAAPAGPWQAVIGDRYGNILTPEELADDDFDLDDVEIAIVRGSAAPVEEAGEFRRPGSYQTDDLLVEFTSDDFEGDTDDEVRAAISVKLTQAQAMVAGLNAAAGVPS